MSLSVREMSEVDLVSLLDDEGRGVDRLSERFIDRGLLIKALPRSMSAAFWRDGSLVAAIGLGPIWYGRGVAWAMFHSAFTTADMLGIHRWAQRLLNDAQDKPEYRRVEMTVVETFLPGLRWARMLGFSEEGIMRCYDPMGRDHVLLARVR